MLKKPASAVSKTKENQPLDVQTYVQHRIDYAQENGWTSTKMWVRKENTAEAYHLLTAAGFKYQVVKEEDKSVQLEVRW